jgi:hypothetical protein
MGIMDKLQNIESHFNALKLYVNSLILKDCL